MGSKLDLSNVPQGMAITTQFQNFGITFSSSRKVKAYTSLPPSGGNAIQSASATAPTPTQPQGPVGTIPPLGHSLPIQRIHATFAKPLSRLTLFINSKASVEIFDKDGRGIGQDSNQADTNEWRQVRLSSATGQIWSLGTMSLFGSHAIGRIVMYENVPPEPDFRLVYSGRTIKLRTGVPTAVSVRVLRLNDSIGGVLLASTSPVPDLLDVNLPATEYNSDKDEFITFTITARREDIQPGITRKPIIVTGLATLKNGYAGDSSKFQEVQIPWTIQEGIDVRITGMEITQGIQEYTINSVRDDNGQISYSQEYRGVGLVKGRKTLVKVFIGINQKPKYPFEDYIVKLHGWQDQHHDTQVLQASPLQTISNNGKYIGDTYTMAERFKYPLAVDFLIPISWTTFPTAINLRAEIVELNHSFTYDSNPGSNIFTITNIRFMPRLPLSIMPYKLVILDNNGNERTRPIHSLASIFDHLKIMHPIADNSLDLLPWAGTINVTDIFDSTTTADAKGLAMLARLRKTMRDAGKTVSKYIPVGVFPAWVNATNFEVRSWGDTNDPSNLRGVIVEDEHRPWSTVAHEIGHYLGRKHASAAGGADEAEDWPPDQEGLIQGLGWDFANGRYVHSEVSFTGKYVTKRYDYMSYHNEGELWQSVRGWRYLYGRFAPSQVAGLVGVLPVGVTMPVVLDKKKSVVVIEGQRGNDGKWILSDVSFLENHHETIGSRTEDEYAVLILDKSGKTITQGTPKVESPPQRIVLENEVPVLQLFATIAVADPSLVRTIQVTQKGIVVVQRSRPDVKPRIDNLGVTFDAGSNYWVAKYNVTSVDKQELSMAVCYQTDGEAEWRLVESGPVVEKGGEVKTKIPATDLPRASKFKVQVKVSDGFNEVVDEIST